MRFSSVDRSTVTTMQFSPQFDPGTFTPPVLGNALGDGELDPSGPCVGPPSAEESATQPSAKDRAPVPAGSKRDAAPALTSPKPTPAALVESEGLSEFEARPGDQFSLSEARSIVGQNFRPQAWIYWTDLLVSWSIGMLAFKLVLGGENLPLAWQPYLTVPMRGVMFLISCLLIYRCGLFIHELAHLPEGQFRLFRRAWNTMCGVPFLIPSFVYLTHVDHHRRKHYGTDADGEYLPLSSKSPWHIVFYLAQSFVIPILAVLRFGVLTPLTWFNTPLRDWVHRHASSMIIDPTYLRPLPTAKALRLIRWQEFCTFVFIVVFGGLIAWGAFGDGPTSPWTLLQAYCTGVFIITMNAIRTLGAHRWVNKDDSQMSFVEQMLDSVTYPTGWTATIWAPLGLRYHALHHIFPSMPYHALGEAHRRLMAGLPADSPYRRTMAPSLWGELARLWHRAAASQRG